MTSRKHTMSIKNLIIIVFILILIVSVTSIAYLVFTRWHESAVETVARISDSINKQIHQQVTSFMDEPVKINEANHKLIRDGILDIQDTEKRERFFVGALRAFDEKIYSFSYGTADGYYYGARRNEAGVVQIMRNDASTGGNSWYYTVNTDRSAGEIATRLGQFDPRTRPWYHTAVQAGDVAFSPPYKHFVMDDLTISVAIPVYNSSGMLEGVMGTHMLLSGIGEFLVETAEPYKGDAIIVERESGLLIANSMGSPNFTARADGSLDRKHIDQVGDESLKQAFEMFTRSGQTHFSYLRDGKLMHASMREFKAEGLDWIVISTVPGGFLLDQVNESITTTALLVLLSIIVIVVIYGILTSHMFKPVEELLKVTKALAAGDLSKRVPIARNDEIGQISTSFNHVADSLQQQFGNLEQNVQLRTLELQESRDQLSLILHSTGEGIYGIDTEGKCTFCNQSALRMLGYAFEEELLDKNMHRLIHHSLENGDLFPIDTCKIFRSVKDGMGYTAQDEVFWRKDGTSFPVTYQAFPQIREGQVLGGVISFSDTFERRERERKIEYLRCHDSLTGLYNRSCFEEHYPFFDVPENLPISIIFADINALKMTNDIFGHSAGDELIRKSAEIFKENCPEKGITARLGGDEFIMILPRTSTDESRTIMDNIRLKFSEMQVAAMRCSVSLGTSTKDHAGQSFTDIMMDSENQMYQDKTKNRSTISREIIDTLQASLHARCPREKEHAQNVRKLALVFASALDLSEAETSVLERSAYLHDIGKIVLDPKNLASEELTDVEMEQMRQHPAVGYRILNLFDNTLDLAEYVYGHHERWDGSGYPRGLKHEQIPFISRILSIIESYERIIERESLSGQAKEKALQEIRIGSETQFDPELAKIFSELMGNS